MATWTPIAENGVEDDFQMSDKDSDIAAMLDVEEGNVQPPQLHQVCKLLNSVAPQLEAIAGRIELPDDLLDAIKQITDRVERIKTKPHTVAVVGRTGVGKSTLTCAMLKCAILPSFSVEACTATITEISYHESADLKATVKFVTRDEWKEVLLLLKGDLSVTADDPDTTDASPASRARARFIEVYPHLRNETLENWTVDRLLSESPVRELLGSERVITEADPYEFQRKLLACVTSCGTSSDQPTLWPLVSIVHVFGQFEVLRNGVTLVDLPGHGDTNSERNQLAEDYLKRADCILLVTEMKRAKNDRETINYLRKLLTEISVDGRTHDASVALVVTGSDNQTGDNECPLTDTETLEIKKCLTDMKISGIREKELTTAGAVLEKKLRSSRLAATKTEIQRSLKTLRSKSENNINNYLEINRARNIILARARSKYVRTQLQEIYSQIQQELSHGPATSLPIFCVGSRDYLGCLHLQPNPPLIWRQESQSGIPELQDYVARFGEKENLADARLALRDTQDFLGQFKALFSPPDKHDISVQNFQNKASNAMARFSMRAQKLNRDAICDIRREFSVVAKEVDDQAMKVKTKSANIIKDYGSKEFIKWNTYRACMRRNGVWQSVDLNERLTKDIFEGVMSRWNKTVNLTVPSRMSQLVEDLVGDFDITLEGICSDAPGVLVDNVKACRSFGFQSRLEDSCATLRNKMLTAQRTGSRAPKEVMKSNLCAHYQDVGRQTGLGLFEKMKDMNVKYIKGHGDELYNAVAKDIRDMFSNLASDMEAEMTEGLTKVIKLILSLLKPTSEFACDVNTEKTGLGRLSNLVVSLLRSTDEKSIDPELRNIINWAEKVHSSINSMLDSVEVRLAELAN